MGSSVEVVVITTDVLYDMSPETRYVHFISKRVKHRYLSLSSPTLAAYVVDSAEFVW